jgi:chromosome partitioning protein
MDSPVIVDAQPARLQKALEKAAESGVDLAIIDTPARSEQSALAAAKLADLVIIPCRPQIYDMETIPNSREIISLAGGKPALVVLNAVPPRQTRQQEALEAIQGMGMPVSPFMLGSRTAFGDSAAMGRSVLEYDPSGKAAEEVREVYKYIISIIDKSQIGEVANDSKAKARSRRRVG